MRLPKLESLSLPPRISLMRLMTRCARSGMAWRSRSRKTGRTLPESRSGTYPADEAPLAEIVGAPADAHLVGLLPVAYYTGTTFKPAPRRPLDEVAFGDRWGDPLG